MRFLYTGIFYDAQTPDFFLRAVSRTVERKPEVADRIQIAFAGLIPDASLQLVKELHIDRLFSYEGYLSHQKVVASQMVADVLWMTVGNRKGAEGISTSKLYEYFGARKPILALVPEGAARAALQDYGAAYVVQPDDIDGISAEIERLYELWRTGRLPEPHDNFVQRFNRRLLTGELAQLLQDVQQHDA